MLVIGQTCDQTCIAPSPFPPQKREIVLNLRECVRSGRKRGIPNPANIGFVSLFVCISICIYLGIIHNAKNIDDSLSTEYKCICTLQFYQRDLWPRHYLDYALSFPTVSTLYILLYSCIKSAKYI